MNFGELVSASRWQILEQIALSPASPIQLAEKIGTSVAYVSQQLKLLEAANIVIKNRTGFADKGKPRNVYAIARDVVTFSALMNGAPVQASIYPTAHQKIIIRIWLFADESLRQPLEKIYRALEDSISEIDGMYVKAGAKPVLYVVSNSPGIQTIIRGLNKKYAGVVRCEVVKSLDADSSFYFLFDSRKTGVQR